MSADRPEAPRPRLTPIDFDPFAGEREQIVLPLTAPQQEVWTAAQMGPEASAAYNVCIPLRLRGRLSVESMRTAVARLVERHEALRTRFSPAGDTQTVVRESIIPVIEVDVAALPPDDQERAVAELLAHESRRPFDLAAGPMARMHILREGPDAHLVVLTAHHLICDGWSSALVLQDLAAFYTADRHGLAAAPARGDVCTPSTSANPFLALTKKRRAPTTGCASSLVKSRCSNCRRTARARRSDCFEARTNASRSRRRSIATSKRWASATGARCT